MPRFISLISLLSDEEAFEVPIQSLCQNTCSVFQLPITVPPILETPSNLTLILVPPYERIN